MVHCSVCGSNKVIVRNTKTSATLRCSACGSRKEVLLDHPELIIMKPGESASHHKLAAHHFTLATLAFFCLAAMIVLTLLLSF